MTALCSQISRLYNQSGISKRKDELYMILPCGPCYEQGPKYFTHVFFKLHLYLNICIKSIEYIAQHYFYKYIMLRIDKAVSHIPSMRALNSLINAPALKS